MVYNYYALILFDRKFEDDSRLGGLFKSRANAAARAAWLVVGRGRLVYQIERCQLEVDPAPIDGVRLAPSRRLRHAADQHERDDN